jgi:aldehyde:ferredoxin oxidoreductase
MGSKNLKAIAVRGTHDIVVAKPDEFMDMVKEFHERMKGPATKKYKTLGTPEKRVGTKFSRGFGNKKLDQRHIRRC